MHYCFVSIVLHMVVHVNADNNSSFWQSVKLAETGDSGVETLTLQGHVQGYVCPQYNQLTNENIACTTDCSQYHRCCSCDRKFYYGMNNCGMSCPDNYYVCLEANQVLHPQSNDACFNEPATTFEFAWHFWEGFMQECGQGVLKDTCAGKLAMAAQTVTEDVSSMLDACRSVPASSMQPGLRGRDGNLSTPEPPCWPKNQPHFGQVLNAVHSTENLVSDVVSIVTACGSPIGEVLEPLITLLKNVDAPCKYLTEQSKLLQLAIDSSHDWGSCLKIQCPANECGDHDLCFQSGQKFADFVKTLFDNQVCR